MTRIEALSLEPENQAEIRALSKTGLHLSHKQKITEVSTRRAHIKQITMDYKQELDRVYSLYIRLRDAFDGGYTQCISCGRVLPFSTMQCGHYFSRRHIATRWDEYNCNAECARCNCNDRNHLEGYKSNLIKKIGKRAFDELEERHKKMADEPTEVEYKELIKGYKQCCRMLSKAKGITVSI